MDCRGLFTYLLASLNLLEVNQLATGNETFAFETGSFPTESRAGSWLECGDGSRKKE